MSDLLNIDESQGDRTVVTFLGECELASSVDGLVWRLILDAVPVGTVYRDFDAPDGARRNYAAIVDGHPFQYYLTGE